MQRLAILTLLFSLSLLLAAAQSIAAPAIEKPAQTAATAVAHEEKADDADEKEDTKSDETDSDDAAAETSKSDKAEDEKKTEDENATDKKDDDAKKSDDDKPKKPAKKKPKPHKVKKDKLKIEVEIDGVFVADEMEQVALRPEVWTRFKVLEAVEHGTKVKKGEVLIRFDDEKLEEDLAEEALDQNIGQLSLLQDEEEFPRIKRLLELNFQNAERRYERTKDDYEYYHETDRPFSVQIANFRYKSAQQQLAAAREELEQLQQMYDADELTEETEEIVLKRQRFAVETAELMLELNKESRDYTLNVSLPRNDEYYETALEEAEIAYKQAKTAVEMGATRKSYEMEKKREARAKSVERHGKLLNDKGLMTLRAPCDGVVYYGKHTNGKWSQISSLKAKLRPFGTVSPNTVLMTIVKPGALHILSSVGEKDLPDLETGQKATIKPTADNESELAGEVASILGVPGASNKFQVRLHFDNEEAPKWLVAGMTCDAHVVTYENDEAIVIPQDLVQTDEDDEDQKYVMLVDPDEDEPVRRNVKLGHKQDKIVEVLKGLDEGDEIVKEPKKDDKD